MKVLQINGVSHQGSTGKIVDSINRYLESKGVSYFVCYGIGFQKTDGYKFCYRYEQALYRRCSMISGYRYGFAPFSTNRLLRFIQKYKPDVVHLHSINGNCVNIYRLLKFLKKHKIPTVLTNHAEFLYTGNCTSTYGCDGYLDGCKTCGNLAWATDHALRNQTNKAWNKMKSAYEGFEKLIMVSVSPYTKERAMRSPLVSDFEHRVVLNGVDTSVYKPTYAVDIREKFGIGEKKIGLFVTSGFSTQKEHLKGGYWFLKVAERLKDRGYHFIVVGAETSDLKYDHITFAGRVSDPELMASLYTQADVSLAFSKSETFGMTCVESLCCGTPFVGFLCGGTESVAIKEYTRFCPYGDVDRFVVNVEEMVSIFFNQKKQISNAATALYANEKMATQYYEIYQEIRQDEI